MKKILIVTDVHPVLVEDLEAMGMEVHYSPGITKLQAMAILPDFQGLVVRTQFPIDHEFLSVGRNLEFIGRAGAGLDNIDLDFTEKAGITCLNAPEGNRDAVAEHTVGLILSLANHIYRANAEVRSGIWKREENRGFEIGSKTIGIIGMGNTGTALAKKLSGFGCRVLGYDKYYSGFAKDYVEESSLEDLFNEADILSLHIPLSPETRNMVDEEFLSHFRKPFWIMNTSRGEIIKTKDLVEALKTGKILGAGLDVLESEKFPDTLHKNWFQDLIQFNSVILTPHVAGWTVESYYKISKVLSEKIRKFYKIKGTKN
jgi:D-3-phosphoglycerate dehydrogenase